MHSIEPFERWLPYYDASADPQSPFYEKEYNYDQLDQNLYGYYIHPAWDSFGSDTLYLKVLYAEYQEGYMVIELLGEWNDAIENDIMTLKRGFLELAMAEGIHKFILIGEHLLNFHGSDDAYYEEWWEEVRELGGWIATVGFPDFVRDEQGRFGLNRYLFLEPPLELPQWRTFHPLRFCEQVEAMLSPRLLN